MDSSIANLKSFSGYVEWWGDMNITTGVNALQRLWDNPAAHESQHVTAEILRRRHYDYATNQKILFHGLDALVGERRIGSGSSRKNSPSIWSS